MLRLLLAALVFLFVDPAFAQTTKKKAPTKPEPTKTEPAKTATADGKININTANIAELDTLNGIGEATAKKIIEYREANGPFKTIDDLTKVSGIGPKTLEKFRDLITTGDGTVAPPSTNTKTTTPAVAASTEAKININTANLSELNKLNGVGDVTAKKIIEYREKNGPFKTIDDVSKVTGVGPKTFEKFKSQITIDGSTKAPEITTPTPSKDPAPVAVSSSNKININTASIAELNKLNGVGDVTAKRIIEYRDANGPFKSIEDLGKVNGIGPKTLEKFRDQVTLGDGSVAPVTPATNTPTTPVKAAGPVVNINTADAKELGKLPGVGDTTAQRIIEYRQANGPFKSCKDLGNVKGIGDKTLEKIEPSCSIK
jgi:competence protein ComEA